MASNLATENLSFKDNGWWTCGCGGSKKTQAIVPLKSKTIFMKLSQTMVGPVTGIEYNFLPHQNSIDVDESDADYWVQKGAARPMLTGYKGRLTRTGVVHDKTK